jgi:DNA-binding Xre family transcriptional regulator
MPIIRDMEYKFTLPEIVKARGLSASKLAQLVGISRPAAYSLMRPGTAQIKLETLNKICQGLHLTPAELFTGGQIIYGASEYVDGAIGQEGDK